VSPDCLIARGNLGNHYGRHGKYENALEQYKEQTRIDPKYARGWRSCARMLQRLNRPDEAIEYFRKSVAAADAKNPRSYSIHQEYADYLYSLKRYQEALGEYEAILKKRPPKKVEDRVQGLVNRLRTRRGAS
jgi:tetratricopeptide (TPR) repeat protein